MPTSKNKKETNRQVIYDDSGKDVIGHVKNGKFVFTDPELADLEIDFDSKPPDLKKMKEV